MAYFYTCPYCGSNLDPGEKCTCQQEAAKRAEFYRKHTKVSPRTGQMKFVFENKKIS